jgi:ribosomal protein S15P/S13E
MALDVQEKAQIVADYQKGKDLGRYQTLIGRLGLRR